MPASFLRRLAMGLQNVFSASVPSLNTGNIITVESVESGFFRRRVLAHQVFDLFAQRTLSIRVH